MARNLILFCRKRLLIHQKTLNYLAECYLIITDGLLDVHLLDETKSIIARENLVTFAMYSLFRNLFSNLSQHLISAIFNFFEK